MTDRSSSHQSELTPIPEIDVPQIYNSMQSTKRSDVNLVYNKLVEITSTLRDQKQEIEGLKRKERQLKKELDASKMRERQQKREIKAFKMKELQMKTRLSEDIPGEGNRRTSMPTASSIANPYGKVPRRAKKFFNENSGLWSDERIDPPVATDQRAKEGSTTTRDADTPMDTDMQGTETLTDDGESDSDSDDHVVVPGRRRRRRNHRP